MANAFTPEQISQILDEFFKTVGTRQYIGMRYVPLFGRKDETSIEWDNSKPYEPLTVVLYQGNSYTSRQYVPEGVEITNQEFWARTGNYNAQIEQYRQEVAEANEAILELAESKADKTALESTNADVLELAESKADKTSLEDTKQDIMRLVQSFGLSKTIGFDRVASGGHTGMQGGCIADGMIYYCTEGAIFKYSLTTGNLIASAEHEWIGHGNTISFDNGYLYVLGQASGNNLYKVDPTTLESIDVISLDNFMYYPHAYFAYVNSGRVLMVTADTSTPYYNSEISVWTLDNAQLVARRLFDFKNTSGFYFNCCLDDDYAYLGFNDCSMNVYEADTLELITNVTFSDTINGQKVSEFEFMSSTGDKLYIGGINYSGSIKLVGYIDFDNPVGLSIPRQNNISFVGTAVQTNIHIDNTADAIAADGSIARPFNSLDHAILAAQTAPAKYKNFVFAQGQYLDEGPTLFGISNALLAGNGSRARTLRVNWAENVVISNFAADAIVNTYAEIQINSVPSYYTTETPIVIYNNVGTFKLNDTRIPIAGYNTGIIEYIPSYTADRSGKHLGYGDVAPLVGPNAPKNIACAIPATVQESSFAINMPFNYGYVRGLIIATDSNNRYLYIPFTIPSHSNSSIVYEGHTIAVARTTYSYEVSDSTIQHSITASKLTFTASDVTLRDLTVLY